MQIFVKMLLTCHTNVLFKGAKSEKFDLELAFFLFCEVTKLRLSKLSLI